MFRVLDSDSPISKEGLLQFEEILGKKLPEAMKILSQEQRGQPQVMDVHDDCHLFPSIPLIHLGK